MREANGRTSALEWVSAAIGLALLILVVVMIGRDALAGEDKEPPAITVEPRKIVLLEQGFLVEFDAVNATGGAAAAVAIEGTLIVPGRPSEAANVALDYVGGEARVPGGLFFKSDPRQGALTLRALGYQRP